MAHDRAVGRQRIDEHLVGAQRKLFIQMIGQDQRQFEEFGDLLFVMVNLGLRLGIDAEAALRAANTKFTRRMDSMAAQARENGHVLESMTLDEMNVLWDRVKDGEKSKERG